MSAAGPLNDEPTAPNERKQSLLNAASDALQVISYN